MEAYKSEKHCAFTDLAYHEGAWYLVFREGQKHMFSNGRIVILKSADGEKWEKFTETKTMNDVRDPRFYKREGNLFVLINFQRCDWRGKKVVSQEVLLWDMRKSLKEKGKTLFINFVKGEEALAYNPVAGRTLSLINFKKNKIISLPAFTDTTEGAFFDVKGKRTYLIRRDINPSYWIKEINKREMVIISTGEHWHCPYIFQKDGMIYFLARKTAKNYKTSQLWLSKIDPLKLKIVPLKRLEGFGDCGYFGYANGLISYYSSYDKKETQKTAIYIEKVEDFQE